MDLHVGDLVWIAVDPRHLRQGKVEDFLPAEGMALVRYDKETLVKIPLSMLCQNAFECRTAWQTELERVISIDPNAKEQAEKFLKAGPGVLLYKEEA